MSSNTLSLSRRELNLETSVESPKPARILARPAKIKNFGSS
jgi:hypothetical protein